MNECLNTIDFERYVARALDEASRSDVRGHLAKCDSCQTSYQQFLDKKSRADETQPFVTDAPSSPFDVTTSVDGASVPLGATTSRSDETTFVPAPTGRVKKKFPEIEGYKILDVLGQGGMGTVYRAVQSKLSRTVALKVLHAVSATVSPDMVTRFRREATAAGRLHHTNIIPVYDFGESPDGYFYAMELIAGQPLNALVRHFAEQHAVSASPARLAELLHASTMVGSPVDGGSATQAQVDASTFNIDSSAVPNRPYFREVARWMTDAADALHYAHGQDIIHRDIKPANLVLSVDGRVMIADFGLAKTSADQSMTATGTLVGTLRYMSPEQAMAKRVRLDYRTDIYSLGATMYELLCFQPAFPGEDHNAILSAVIARDPTPPHKINGAVPAELGTICLKCLEKAPDARYADAKGMADDLRRYLSDLPIVARRPGPIRRVAKFVRRHKAPVAAVTALVLLLASVPIVLHEREARRVQTALRLSADIERLYESAMFYAGEGAWVEADLVFNSTLELDPNCCAALVGLAWMKLEQWTQNPDEVGPQVLRDVDELAGRVVILAPGNGLPWFYRGIARKRLADYPGAIKAFREAILCFERTSLIEPQESAANSNLGAIYLSTGQFDDAKHFLTKGAEIIEETQNAEAAAAWRNLAAFELFQNDPRSFAHIVKSLAANWIDPMSWVIRARVELDLEGHVDPALALDHAKHADTAAKYQSPKAKRMRAMAHLRNEQLREAIRNAEEAIALEDMPTVNHLIIAIARARIGNRTGARESLDSAESGWPADLREPGAYDATLGSGDLWIDTADELIRLREEANAVLAAPAP